MANILSQEEVDALLGALPSEDAEDGTISAGSAPHVAPYDFRRPHRISREQIRLMQNLHESFARQLGMGLSAVLRGRVEVEVLGLEQMSYEEYIFRMQPVTNIFLLRLKEEEESLAMLEVQSTLALALIDRTLGGPGTSPEQGRQLTMIEVTLISQMVQSTLPGLREAWSPLDDLDPVLSAHERNPHLLQILPPMETVLVLSLRAILPHAQGMITMAYPSIHLEPVLARMGDDPRRRGGGRRDVAVAPSGVKQVLQKTTVDVVAVFGSGSLTIREFLNLRVGDVIALDQEVDAPSSLRVGGHTKFLARPGLAGRRRAVQVLDHAAERTAEPQEGAA